MVTRGVHKEDGAVAVEFAIVMILLFMILFGVIEFGITLSRYQMYVGAAREGSRYAAVRCKPEAAQDCSSNPSLIIQRMKDSMGCGSCANSDVFFPGTPTEMVNGTPGQYCNDPNAGKEVAVTWTQHFSIQIPFVPDLSFNKDVKGVFRCE
jgi:Flp pilus assembly protein TadG